MPQHTLSPPAPAWPRRPSPARTLLARLHDAWRSLLRSEREEFLSHATSHAELEQRLRRWDDYCVTRAWQRPHW